MLVTAHLFYSALSFIILERALSLKPVYFSGNCNVLKRNKTDLRVRLEKAISTASWIRYNCYVEKLARKNVKNVLSTNPYKYKHGNLILEGLLIYNKWPFGEETLINTVKQFAKELKKLIIVTAKASPTGNSACCGGGLRNCTKPTAPCSLIYTNTTTYHRTSYCETRRVYCLGRRDPRHYPDPTCKINKKASSDFDYFFTRIAVDLPHQIIYDLDLENCAYKYQTRDVWQRGIGRMSWQTQCKVPPGKIVKAEYFQYVGDSDFFNVYNFAKKAHKAWYFTRIFKKAYGSTRVGCSLRMTCDVFEAACFFSFFER